MLMQQSLHSKSNNKNAGRSGAIDYVWLRADNSLVDKVNSFVIMKYRGLHVHFGMGCLTLHQESNKVYTQ